MFISIIIPVYNTEKYLDECLQSIIKQNIDCHDYEIICVNDGSTDESLEVLYRLKKNHPTSNIIIINQENSGVCSARNAGINIAQGDYIWFIDSDDYIEKNVLAELKEKAYSANYDRIIFGHYYFTDNGEKHDKKDMKINTLWFDSVVTRSIFKREFLLANNLYFRYPELTYGEDAIYMYEVKRHLPKTMDIKNIIYYVRGRAKSASSEQNTPEGNRKKLVSSLREAQIMKKYYEAGDESQVTVDRLMSFLWGTIFRIVNLPRKEANSYLKQLKECGLYPYKRPKRCTIKKSYQINREDFIGKCFDKIYINLHTRCGYFIMRLWIFIFSLKKK